MADLAISTSRLGKQPVKLSSRPTAERTERVGEIVQLDAVDVALLDQLQRHPRVGILEIARRMGVARGTASAHLQRLEREGVITGYGPDIDLAAAGFGVQAIVTLEISQGALEQIRAELDQIENVVEAHATTGSGDVVCRVAARSHEALQQVLLDLNRSRAVARSTSVVILSELVSRRTLPLVRSGASVGSGRSPSYRTGRRES